MSDKDPLGAMIRELAPISRFNYLVSELGHSYVNLYVEGLRALGVKEPQGPGRVAAIVSILVVLIGFGAAVMTNCGC